jgi:signal transduction histidine kinase
MTELVLDTELTSEQRDSLGPVRLSPESLLSVINDVLDFSKIEAGKLAMESIPSLSPATGVTPSQRMKTNPSTSFSWISRCPN